MKEIILAGPKVKVTIPPVVKARSIYKQKIDELDPLLHPTVAREAAQSLVKSATTAEEIKKAKAKALEYQAIDDNATAAARKIARAALNEFKPCVANLVAAAEDTLAGALAENKQAEVEFFKKFGLPHEPTAVTRIFDNTAITLSDFRKALSDEADRGIRTPSPSQYDQILQWFGIE